PHFIITAPVTATGGAAINFLVSAPDANGLFLPTYAGTVRFTSSDSAAILPANAPPSNGGGNLSAPPKTPGAQSLTGIDTANSGIFGSANISVAAGANGTPAPVSVTPAGGNTATQQFQFVFTDSAGYQDLGVLNILINNFLDGRHACYLAYSQPANT